jgi:cyclohexanone monooxygenase
MSKVHYDAIIIGAGFGGLYALKKLRDEQGLNVRVFDKNAGIGGTWFANRYPGALSDTESFVYCYSWDKEMLQEFEFTTRYVTQPQILAYLQKIVQRHNLEKDVQLSTNVDSALFNEKEQLWEVTCSDGNAYTTKHLVTALGLLSATNVPNIKGLNTFQGEWLHTADWPDQVKFTGKRVGIIGTGSTGTQVITAIAPDVGHLSVFQRSPQYTVPVGNGPVTPEYVADIKNNYDKIWDQVKNSMVAFGFKESTVPAMSVSAEERKAVFQKAWDLGGGFRFMFETFSDIAVSEEANKAAQDFIREKISEIVKDPETARTLTPHDLYAKRPLCDSGYYATFNRTNVSLVDVKADPIQEITPKGVRTVSGKEYELDVIIFATGFDAVDGNYTKMNIRGRNGEAIQNHWKSGPSSLMGVMNNRFPNMYMVLGPNGPFTNLPPTIETQVEFICELIKKVKTAGLNTVEPTDTAVEDWTKTCQTIAHQTLFPKAESWIFGANIPGKSNTVYFYMAGLGAYRQELQAMRAAGYTGLAFN